MKSIEIKQKALFKYLTITSSTWGFLFRFFMRSQQFQQMLFAQIEPLSHKSREAKSIYIITSVVSPSPRKLSYSIKRSIFEDADRLQQTIYTLESIRKYDSSADIALIDCSKNQFPLTAEFNGVEVYRIRKLIPRLVINGPFKGLGEAIMLITSFNLTSQYKVVSKISGRYQLSRQPISTAEVLFSFSNKKAITIYYRMPFEVYQKWLKFIESNMIKLSAGVSMELLLTEFTKNFKLNPVDKLGVEGLNGITGGLTNL